MKSFFLSVLLLVSITSFSQITECSRLWLNDPYDSIDVIKKTTEQYLQAQLKMSPNDGIKTMYELKDADDLSLLKIWMKGKKVVSGGSVTTAYSVSSFKVIAPAERIESLFAALKEKVGKCSTESTDALVVFASGKITIEKQGGDWSKKNIPIHTLTVTTAK